MATTIDITSDIAPTLRALGASRQQALTAQRVAVEAFGEAYRDELIAQTPRGEGEAEGRKRLFESYDARLTDAGATVTYRITNRAPQLRYVLNGRPAVTVKRARALRFVIRGVVLFRKRVKAAPANNYPARVRQTMEGQRRQMVADVARGVVSAMRGVR